VRRLEIPEEVMVAWDGRSLLGLNWRGRRRLVQRTKEIWSYRSEWWREATLRGERREYHTILTDLGALELLCRIDDDARRWFVVAVWD
jgi:hypothetical protein